MSNTLPEIIPGQPPANLEDYAYISQQSNDQVGIFISPAGTPTDPDSNVVLVSLLPDSPNATPVFSGRSAARQTIGTYVYTFLSTDTAQQGFYHLAWTYQINGVPDTFLTPVQIGSFNPAYDALAPEAKYIVELVWAKFCVDEETEALTRNGWKRIDYLNIGDEIFTLNHETGLSEWQTIDDLTIIPVENEPMLSIETQGHSSLTTMYHKWPIFHSKRVDGKLVESTRDWRKSSELNSNDAIITAAPFGQLPIESKWSDDFVEIVGWFWTEGNIKTLPSGTRLVSISQSERVNPTKTARIRKSLTNIFGPQRKSDQKVYNSIPSWSELDCGTHISFSLNAAASKEFLMVAPNKILSFDFLHQLTQSQLLLLIDISMMADGHINKVNSYQISQSSSQSEEKSQLAYDRLEAFNLACILAGKTPRSRVYNKTYKGKSFKSFNTTIKFDSVVRFPSKSSNGTSTTQTYTGNVWCPTTKNHTWMARRHGTVYFTGNCDGYDSQFGGPNLQSYFQSHFSRGRLAQLLYMRLQTINVSAQPVNNWSLTASNPYYLNNDPIPGAYPPGTTPPALPPGTSPPWPPYGTPTQENTPSTVLAPSFTGPAFPYAQWSGLLISGLTIEVIKHLMRSYVEEPLVEGNSQTHLTRRDYMDRWGVILRSEEAEYKEIMDVFKIRQMFSGQPRVLVSGGVFGVWNGPTRLAGSAAARPRYYTRM